MFALGVLGLLTSPAEAGAQLGDGNNERPPVVIDVPQLGPGLRRGGAGA